MKIVGKIKEISLASLLLLTLMLPSCIQFSHQLVEEHEYKLCHETEEHIHEVNVHCDLCCYQFTSFTFEFTSYPELIAPTIISKTTLGSTTPLCYYSPLTNELLRGPPALS